MQKIGFFFFFLFYTFFLYRNAMIALPRADHGVFMLERLHHTSEWEYFKNALSFNRTRHFAKGDYYLFRPGTTGLLAILDIFSHHNMFFIGALSIFLHGTISFLMFLILSGYLSKYIAFLFSLFFATQYSGVEMILWRHISPYQFNLLFFGLGILLMNWLLTNSLVKDTFSNSHRILCALLFFLSCLFHETTPAALLLSGLFLFGISYFEGFRKLSRKNIFVMILLPSIIYWLINFCDIFIHHPPQFFGSSMDKGWHDVSIPNLILQLLKLGGLCGIAALFPSLTHLSPSTNRDFFAWDFTSISPVFLSLIGVSVFLCLGTLFVKSLIKKEKSFISISLFFFYFITLIGSLSLGRYSQRGEQYIMRSTYYYYFSNFVLIVIGSYIAHTTILQKFKIFLRTFIIFFLCASTAFSYSKIQNLVRYSPEGDSPKTQWYMNKLTWNLGRAIQKNRPLCLGGNIYPKITPYLIPVVLGRETCKNSDNNIVYISSSNGRIALSKIDELIEPIQGDLSKIQQSNSGDFKIISQPRTLFSYQEYFLKTVGVQINNPTCMGLFFAFKNYNDFSMLLLEKDALWLLTQRENKTNREFIGHLKESQSTSLVLRKIEATYFLFVKDFALRELPFLQNMDGKIGLIDCSSPQDPQTMGIPFIAKKNYLVPLVTLNLPIPDSKALS